MVLKSLAGGRLAKGLFSTLKTGGLSSGRNTGARNENLDHPQAPYEWEEQKERSSNLLA